MIGSNIVNYLACFGLLCWLIYLVLWQFEIAPCSRFDEMNLQRLEKRLSGYAALKGMKHCQGFDLICGSSGDRFEVLLGILKKTEAKSLGLSTVWSLAITSLVAAYGIKAFKPYQITLMCLIIGSLPMVFLSLVIGMNHVAQCDFDKIDGKKNSAYAIRDCMRKQLMCDLLRKEKALKLASEAAGGLVAIMMTLGFFSLATLIQAEQ